MQSTDGPAREQVVQHVHGPLEIQAGHGTGKTTLLLDRFAYLVRQRLAWPYEVLLLTFTRRAATEMRERLQLLLGEDTDDLPILTLHAFARRLLASQPDYKHNPFILFDPNQAFRVMRRAMADVGLPETLWPPTFVAGLIADAKERGSGPEAFVTVPDSPAQRALGGHLALTWRTLDNGAGAAQAMSVAAGASSVTPSFTRATPDERGGAAIPARHGRFQSLNGLVR